MFCRLYFILVYLPLKFVSTGKRPLARLGPELGCASLSELRVYLFLSFRTCSFLLIYFALNFATVNVLLLFSYLFSYPPHGREMKSPPLRLPTTRPLVGTFYARRVLRLLLRCSAGWGIGLVCPYHHYSF